MFDLEVRSAAQSLPLRVFQGCPTMQRLAAVNGLVALVGSESYLIQVGNPHVSLRKSSMVSPHGGAKYKHLALRAKTVFQTVFRPVRITS